MVLISSSFGVLISKPNPGFAYSSVPQQGGRYDCAIFFRIVYSLYLKAILEFRESQGRRKRGRGCPS